MDLLVAFVIVGLVGYFVMTNKSKPGCFAWCDVGKALLLWGMTEAVVYLIKGPLVSVSIVKGGEYEGGDSEEDKAFFDDLFGEKKNKAITGGGSGILRYMRKTN